ncbi:MAG: mechanosensitive ion channel family protein [Methanomassiliicoccales archaeon]|nr:mechanosensitive ion channel family protein [Methanomassiliicoccales archaeon]
MANVIDLSGVTIEQILVVVLILLVAVFLAKAASALIRRYLDDRISKNWSKGLARIIQYVILGIGLYIGFYEIFRVSVSAMLASLGIVGLAIAFASQQVIQNAISGILISVTRPIRLEDWVEVGGTPDTGVGRVKDITLLTTVLRDGDGRISYIPNSMILTTKVINYTKSGFVALRVRLTVMSPIDFGRLKQIVLEVTDEDPLILPNVTEEEHSAVAKIIEIPNIRAMFEHKHDMSALNPKVTISDISETKVGVVVKFWIREINLKDEITSGFLNKLGTRLENEGIRLIE